MIFNQTTLAALLASTALVLGTNPAAFAADPAASNATAGDSDSTDDATGSDFGPGERFIPQQKSSQTLANSIIGMSIHNSDTPGAKAIGKVIDLILNNEHELIGVVVGVGGFLGMGQKDVGIPWSQVSEINPETKTARVKLTREELEQAPPFITTEQHRKREKAMQDQQAAQERARQPAPAGAQPMPIPAPAAAAPGGE